MAKRILIVGGVAGGASASARLRRLDETAEIIIFERGDYISFANCGPPYYIGGEINDRDDLLLQTFLFNDAPTGRIGLIVQNAKCRFDNLKAWTMSL